MAPGPVEELIPSQRTLLGPGPSDVDPRVLRAMSTPILGYLDPEFIQIMDGVAEMLREVFGTADAFTLPISGTGSAGMEAALANLLEPGELYEISLLSMESNLATNLANSKTFVIEVIPPRGAVLFIERTTPVVVAKYNDLT